MDHTLLLETKVRKRKQRAILSCNDCRRRKLKCDRELPCNRCINGGVAETCAYSQDVDPSSSEGPIHQTKRPRTSSAQPCITSTNLTTPVYDDTAEHEVQPRNALSAILGKDRVEYLEDRVASLETLLSSLQDKTETKTQSNISPGLTYYDGGLNRSTGFHKGRGFRTFFYGATSPLTIIAHFPDLRPFMKQTYLNSTLERLKREYEALESRVRAKNALTRAITVPNLRTLLPDRATVDAVVQTYLNTFETTYRILHVPTFEASYRSYWDAPYGINTEMDAIVLAILACTLCTSTHDTTGYGLDGSTFRSKAIVWIKACEAWLRRQSNKHRTLASLQVRCLRLVGLSTTCLKTKEYYQETQAHLSFMASCGMHRNPSILGARCSVFEGEMRRRLWATSLEVELQAAIDKGTPSFLSSLEYDCPPPSNINDTDLKPEMKHLPAPQPTSQFTDTSFLHFSIQTAPLRTKLCALANTHYSPPNFQETLHYEQEVQDALEQIPKWTGQKALQAWTLLDLQLRQYCVILHTKTALQVRNRVNANHRYAVLMCLEASAVLIQRHITVLESGNYALCCMRSDYLRAALLICHLTYHARKASDLFVSRFAKSIFDEAMGKAFRLQEERAMRPGRGNHRYWVLSAASSLVGIAFDPKREEILKQQAIDRVAKMLYKVLSLLDDENIDSQAKEVLLGEEATPNPASMSASMNAASFLMQDSFANAAGLDGIGLETVSPECNQWMLDDYWFFNDFSAGQFPV